MTVIKKRIGKVTRHSKYKINPYEPSGWKPDVEIRLLMYYFSNADYYSFVYELDGAARGGKLIDDVTDVGGIISGKIAVDQQGVGRLSGPITLQYLNIGLSKYDKHALITVQTIDKDGFDNLYFDQHVDQKDGFEAVMTYYDQTKFYGELQYSSDGKNFTSVKPIKCRYIRFKANVNKDTAENHKFSYNVRLPYQGNDSFPLEIDPDIQNPKT